MSIPSTRPVSLLLRQIRQQTHRRITHPLRSNSDFQLLRHSRSRPAHVLRHLSASRTFTTTTTPRSPPTATAPKPPFPSPTEPTSIPLSTYHALSDTYIDNLLTHLEHLSDSNPSIDVEYSAGVLTLTYPPKGTYVLNKQPPNRQIWLSSPVSGPKRYDWVASDEEEGGDGTGGKGAEAEEGAKGKWVYLRDGSTLDGLLEEEIGVRMEDLQVPLD